MVNDYETMLCDILSGEATEDYIHRIKGIPLLTREEEKDLFYRIKSGDKIARDKIIIHNLRFAVNYALHYQNYGLSLGDLIQEGTIGIIYAVSRFDVTKEYRFGTYARKWIEQKIKLAIANTARSIRIPIHTFDKLIKYEQVKEKLTKKLNHLPSREEIANELEVSVDIIAQYEEMEKVPLSLNYLIDDNSTEFETFISSNAPSAEDEALKANLPNEIRKLFEVLELDDIDIDVLVKRYGLDGNGIRKYHEIGDAHNRTKVWAMQREKKILTKIKNSKYFKDSFN